MKKANKFGPTGPRIPNRKFGALAREAQARYRNTLPAAAGVCGDSSGRRHGHLLAHGEEQHNLFPGLRGASLPIDGYHRSARSGDTRDVDGPTRNLAGSQPACLNWLEPLAREPGALEAAWRFVAPDLVRLGHVPGPFFAPAPVHYEWSGVSRTLEDTPVRRGGIATRADAVLVGETSRGRCAWIVEWKYCETYPRPKDQAAGSSGQTRERRYRPLYEAATSSFDPAVPWREWMRDPFCQLMRLRLMADVVAPRDLGVDYAVVVVVCPAANDGYRRVDPGLAIGHRFPSLDTVEDVARQGLVDPQGFRFVAQEDWIAWLRAFGAPLPRGWSDYQRLRYGW